MGSLRGLEDQSTLDRYLEIKAQIKHLQDELSQIQDEVFRALDSEPGRTCEHMGCVLSIQYRTTYEYTPETQIAEQELKARKKYEESAGIAAIKSQSGYVVVRAAKTGR